MSGGILLRRQHGTASHRATHGIRARREKNHPSEKLSRPTARSAAADVAQHAKKGDAFAFSIWDETCSLLALACINISRIVDPQVIVIGGGMAAAGKFLIDSIEKHRRENWWKMTPLTAKIVLAKLGNDAGVIGAAGVAKQAHERNTLPAIGK